MTKQIRCQTCGKRLEALDEPHDTMDCIEHLRNSNERMFEMLEEAAGTVKSEFEPCEYYQSYAKSYRELLDFTGAKHLWGEKDVVDD